MLNLYPATVVPNKPPRGLTQAQYDWFKRHCEESQTTLMELLMSYEMINTAVADQPGQGHVLREWIIQQTSRRENENNESVTPDNPQRPKPK